MTTSDTKRAVIANCESCGAVVGAELSDDSIAPLGSTDECGCGCHDFHVLRYS